jgi:hypothetical protein
VEMRYLAAGPRRGRPGRGCGAQEDGNAEHPEPDSHLRASEQVAELQAERPWPLPALGCPNHLPERDP